MEILTGITIFLYMLSTAGYVAYLFLQKDYLEKVGIYLILAGFLIHTAWMGYGFVQSGNFPVNNLHQILSMAA